MLEGAKSIGAGAATIALAGAAIGIGNVFSSLRNPSLAKQLFDFASLIKRLMLASSFSAIVIGFLSLVISLIGYAPFPLGEAKPDSFIHLLFLCITNPCLLFILLFLLFFGYFHVKDTEQRRESLLFELITDNRSKGAIHSISYGWKGISVSAHQAEDKKKN